MKSTLLLLAFFAPAVAAAAPITWRPASELVTDADIDLSFGPVVYAVNGGDNTGNEPFMTSPRPSIRTVTVGGTTIPFEGIEGVYGADSQFGGLGFVFETFGDAADHLPSVGGNVTFSTTATRTVATPQVSFDLADAPSLGLRVYDISTGNADLDAILASQVFFDGRGIGTSALNISLNNLTPGQPYQLQLIGPAAQAGRSRVSQATVNDGLGNSVAGLAGQLDLDGDAAAHVTTIIGVFTADATSQAVNVVLAADRNSGISGLILTTVPEPSAAMLAAAAAVAGVARRRRG